ncbi:hypothetical protein [Noviherbaspirillum suwonense]|nr:hypothetical protein [Noviherbaspirillum suwonense]
MVTMPAIICQCGKRLNVSRGSRVLSLAELKLINVSIRALHHELPEWDYRHVHAHFKSLLAGDDSFLGSYKDVLSNTFSLSGGTKVILSSGRLGRAAACLSFRPNLNAASAPECCGLLVALNVDFDSATKEFRKCALEGKILVPQAKTGGHINTTTVEASRLALLQLQEQHPLRPPSFYQKHYWLLKLKDSDWLYKHFPKTLKTLVPSLLSDRNNILARHAARQTESQKLLQVNGSAAEIRARIRDFAWFEEQRVSIQVTVSKNIDIAKKAVSHSRLTALEKALNQVLEKEQRPSRIFTATLASIAGLSHSQALDTLYANATLRRRIAEANRDKKRRQLLWAAQQLSADGIELNKKQIGKRAGLPSVDISDGILKEIYSLYFNE